MILQSEKISGIRYSILSAGDVGIFRHLLLRFVSALEFSVYKFVEKMGAKSLDKKIALWQRSGHKSVQMLFQETPD